MRKVLVVLLVGIMCVAFCGCNRVGNIVDLRNQANWAEVRYPDGRVFIYELDKWSQDEDGYTLILKNGNVLFVSGVNCLLSKEPFDEVGE